MTKHYQHIVIGLGGIGSATLFHLAQTGRRVLGLEQFHVPHARGSTHGDSRITRLANGEGEIHTQLALRARELWRSLERETDISLLDECGGILVSNDRPGSFNNCENYFSQTVNMAREHAIEHEILDSVAASKRFPQFRFAAGESVLYEPSAGYIHPEAAIDAHLKNAATRGAKIEQDTCVTGIQRSAGRFLIETDRGDYEAEQVVLTVGPWIGKMLPDYRHLFRIVRQIVFYFDVESPGSFAPGRFPVFIRPSRNGSKGIYGFPAIGGPAAGIKVASEYLTQTANLEAVDREVHEEEIREIYENDLKPWLPGVLPHRVRAATCLFTETPDHGFLIDRHPQMPGLIIASPCSGYGFKFAPALGELVSQLALEQEPSLDLTRFSLDRLAALKPSPA